MHSFPSMLLDTMPFILSKYKIFRRDLMKGKQHGGRNYTAMELQTEEPICRGFLRI
jgi:hypothetical protein